MRDLIARHSAAAPRNDPMANCEGGVESLLGLCDETFGPMLRNSKHEQQIRNVLNVMKCHSFLFQLPKTFVHGPRGVKLFCS